MSESLTTGAHYRKVRFLLSAPDLAHAPPDIGAEVAFAGRSNAGKSSAINALTGIGALARTSKTPGRTQHLVFFAIDDERRLVDLPGYGYARVGEAVKRRWRRALQDYLQRRRSLAGLVLVADIRHGLTGDDEQMVHWCAAAELALHVLLTKADKLKRNAANQARFKCERALVGLCPGASVQTFSATARTGLGELHRVLDGWLGYNDSAAVDSSRA